MKTLAISLKNSLPFSVSAIFNDVEWCGGPILQLENEVCRPGASDILVNYHFLRPFVARFADTIPSGFFAADVFIYADWLYNGNLLKSPDGSQDKKTMASVEGGKLKRLMGALRFLWRSSAFPEALRLCPLCDEGHHCEP